MSETKWKAKKITRKVETFSIFLQRFRVSWSRFGCFFFPESVRSFHASTGHKSGSEGGPNGIEFHRQSELSNRCFTCKPGLDDIGFFFFADENLYYDITTLVFVFVILSIIGGCFEKDKKDVGLARNDWRAERFGNRLLERRATNKTK